MRFGTRCIKFIDTFIDTVILVVTIILLLFAIFAIYSAYYVFIENDVYSNLSEYKPDTELVEEGNPSLEELITLYPDVTAWLELYDTNIDYPVVQGEDNEQYVYHNIQSAYAKSGAIFLDYRNNRLYTDPYSLLYGHHVIDGLMFSDVVLFGDYDYFEEHKWGRLWLPDCTYDIELFGVIRADGYDEEIFNPSKYKEYGTMKLVELIEEHSVQWRDVPIVEEDRIIGFSTCTDAFTDGRVILYGVLRDTDFVAHE